VDVTEWSELPLIAWADTCDTLQLWTQVVGKIRLAHAPMVNHWWQVPLYVSSRGLTTSPIPYGAEAFQIDFDFIDHRLEIRTSLGKIEGFPLGPRSVADFYAETMDRLTRLGLETRIWTMPVEIEGAIPFEQDRAHASYDAQYVHRFWRILLHAARLLGQFRAQFIGKASPVHFFWEASTLPSRASRAARRRCCKAIRPTSDAGSCRKPTPMKSAAAASGRAMAGFGRAAFYSYAYPEPQGLADAPMSAGTYYDRELGQFILPYDVVRHAVSPDELVMDYLRRTYEAAATLGKWDRQALERSSPHAGR
jgi:hypothetical protein